MPAKRKTKLSDAKETLSTLKDQVTAFKNEGVPAVKTTISDIANLIKAFQKDIQPHLSQIKEDLGELEQAKEKLEAETAKPSPI
jgi:gas vesicle protein